MKHITRMNVSRLRLQDVDLNLLVVFNHVLVERRVARVAEVLGITQPAVSNALARLRRLLGDELFLRHPDGMQPTPFAEQLAEPVSYALAMIQGALNQHSHFDPATANRDFTIGMTDIGEIYFLPELMQRLRDAAPGVRLSTVRNASINLRDDMEAGKVDLALGLLPQLKAGFFQRRLFRQRYVCLMRKGHALDKKRISLADFSAAPHVVVVSAGTGHGVVDELLKRGGVERNVHLTVPHYVAVGHILQGTDLIATVPERLARKMIEPFGLTAVAHPAKLPEISINVFWHAKFHREPANQWLRGLFVDMFGE
jgi:DNA-binding transcriptional LysR family regulator